MQTTDILSLLIAERDKLNKAIEALTGNVVAKQRGRPRKNATTASDDSSMPEWVKPSTPKKTRKKRIFTAEQRRQAADRMKARWKAKKAPAKKKVAAKKKAVAKKAAPAE